VALLLKRQGITRVRPLLGGFEAWRERGFPVEQKPVQVAELGEAAPESQQA
jgi:3-mercaptopyruvate sulfurtransferase SseA